MYNSQDSENLMKHFFVACNTEGVLFQFFKNRTSFCEACLIKLEQVLLKKYSFKTPKTTFDEDIEKFLTAESVTLDKIIYSNCFVFCQPCSAKIMPKGFEISNSKNSKAKRLKDFKHLLSTIQEKAVLIKETIKEESNNLPIPSEIALTTQTKLSYLLGNLIRIEYKLIAENIKFVLGKNERGVLVSLMNKTPCLYFSENELQKLNTFRENSLFKIHKCGFKSNRYYFSHNKFNESLLRHRSTLSDDILKETRYGFRELKTSSTHPSSDELICHHCKYVGRKSFFYVCSHKQFETKKTDADENLKHIFTFDSDLEAKCDRAFCSYCVRNFYNLEVRKDFFECPFCLGRCYCPTCDYRDFYVRLFSQFVELGGNKDLLLMRSPIQKIVKGIEYWKRKGDFQGNDEIETVSDDENSDERIKGKLDYYQVRRRENQVFKRHRDAVNQKKNDLLAMIKTRKSSVMRLELIRLITEREEKKKEKLIYDLT